MSAERPRRRIVVVPSDRLSSYEEKGRGALLRDYYNPQGHFDEVIALSPLEEGERDAHGMRVIGVPARDFRRRLAAIRPDLVRAYGGNRAADLCCRERVAGVPVVVSVHGTSLEMLRPAVRYADRVFCTSRAVIECVTGFGVSPERIRLLPNRVDLDVFRPVADPGPVVRRVGDFPDGLPVLCIGRASPEKNRETVIRALARLPSRYFALLVGRGDIEGDRELARREGVLDRCFFAESVPNADLPALYSWAACLCNPSRWEGFGVVFAEAAACRAAIVTSDIAPINELFAPDQAALVRDFEDPDSIAGAIVRVCEDEATRAALRGRVRSAAEPFATERVSAREVALYEELLAAEAPGWARRLEIQAWRAWNRAWLRGVRRRLGAGPTRSARSGPASRAAGRPAVGAELR